MQNTDKLKPKTQFMDLNIDCHILILEHLQMLDLCTLARTSEYFSNLAENVLRLTFSKKMVVFSTLSLSKGLLETARIIQVWDVRSAVDILKTFGPNIRNILIDNISEHHDKQKEVFELIQEYCSETLTQFHYHGNRNNYFEYITKPFKNVHNVSLAGQVTSLNNYQFNFQELFPELHSLYFDNVCMQNTSSIALHFPHLEYLYAGIWSNKYTGYVTASVIMNIIRKNPQIRSINFKRATPQLLKIAADFLPNLESLELSYYEENQHDLDIHFKHVKSFKVHFCPKQTVPSGISFGDSLEEYQFQAYPQNHRYTDFIVNNRNLKKIRGKFGLENRDIEQLAAADLNVVEMSIACHHYVRAANLVKLIENCKKLKRLHLSIDSNLPIYEIATSLRERFESEWIIDVKYDSMVLEKKNELSEQIQ